MEDEDLDAELEGEDLEELPDGFVVDGEDSDEDEDEEGEEGEEEEVRARGGLMVGVGYRGARAGDATCFARRACRRSRGRGREG